MYIIKIRIEQKFLMFNMLPVVCVDMYTHRHTAHVSFSFCFSGSTLSTCANQFLV